MYIHEFIHIQVGTQTHTPTTISDIVLVLGGLKANRTAVATVITQDEEKDGWDYGWQRWEFSMPSENRGQGVQWMDVQSSSEIWTQP